MTPSHALTFTQSIVEEINQAADAVPPPQQPPIPPHPGVKRPPPPPNAGSSLSEDTRVQNRMSACMRVVRHLLADTTYEATLKHEDGRKLAATAMLNVATKAQTKLYQD